MDLHNQPAILSGPSPVRLSFATACHSPAGFLSRSKLSTKFRFRELRCSRCIRAGSGGICAPAQYLTDRSGWPAGGGYPSIVTCITPKNNALSQNHFASDSFSRGNQHIHHFLFKFLIILNGEICDSPNCYCLRYHRWPPLISLCAADGYRLELDLLFQNSSMPSPRHRE